MKITVVDTVTLNQNHISILESLGDLRIYEDIPERDELLSRLSETDIAILGWSEINKEILNESKNLKLLSLWSTGYDYVDVKSATEYGISVTNVPGYASQTIGEFVIGLCIAGARKIIEADSYVRNGGTSWKGFEGLQLSGRTIGIVGTGSIGTAVARLAGYFDMEILAYTKHPSKEKANQFNIKYVSMQELLTESDFITLHCALNEETRGFLGKNEFSKIKRGAFLINTARAELIDQEALIHAVRTKRLSGAALDVIEGMPIDSKNPLAQLENVILTPHCAFFTEEAITRKTDICIDNVKKFIAGNPVNIVS